MKHFHNGILVEDLDHFSLIADLLRDKKVRFVVITPNRRDEFQMSRHAPAIIHAADEIHFINTNDFLNHPRFKSGTTLFNTLINGKLTSVRIRQNLGNGAFIVERLTDGLIFNVSGCHHVNSLIHPRQ